MLQAIRERAQGIVAWVMLIVVGVPFMLWGIQNYIDTGKEKPAAVVGDREIFDRDVTRAYEQSLNNLVGLEDYDEKALRKEALERLIRDEVISQSAEERKLTVADVEARSLIQTLPYFQTQGQFDKEKYRIMLAAQNMTPAQFVGQIKRGLRNEQLQQGVMESAFVTKGELETLMRLKNQTRDVRYVKVAVGKSDKVFSDEEVTAFYDAHISEFRNPEQVSVDYVLLNLEDMAKGLEVTQEDLKKLYEEQKTNFGTPERRKISHILITLDGTDEKADQAARQEAETIRQRILKGEDFKELAKTMSKDPLSGKAGGDLGLLNPDAQEASFTEAAQALKLGDTSEPVKTSFGYHLIQVTEVVPAQFKSFDAVKEEIRKTAQKNLAETQFYERGQKLAEITFENPDSLQSAVDSLGLKIQHTALFTREGGEGIVAEEAVRKVAFSEDVLAGKNSEPVEIGTDKAVVLRLNDHRPATDKPLTEVKPIILSRLKDQDARADADRRARELLEMIKAGKGFDEAVKSQNLPPLKALGVKREDQKLSQELVQALFQAGRPLDGQETPGDAVLADGTHLVFTLMAVNDGGSVDADAKVEASGREYLERTSGQIEFATFVKRLRDSLDVEMTVKE